MRGLKICLWIMGILCLVSVVGVFLPISAWESIAKVFDADLVLPDSPMFEYMVRLMCATYAGVGVYFVILALNPMKYGVLIPFSGIAAIALGLVCVITGLIVGMPVAWFLGDASGALVLGVLIVIFSRLAK